MPLQLLFCLFLHKRTRSATLETCQNDFIVCFKQFYNCRGKEKKTTTTTNIFYIAALFFFLFIYIIVSIRIWFSFNIQAVKMATERIYEIVLFNHFFFQNLFLHNLIFDETAEIDSLQLRMSLFTTLFLFY